MRLAGEVAVITGAARGIGAACARQFAREGAVVVAADRDAEALAALEAELRGQGAACVTATVDMGNPDAPAGLVDTAVSRFERIDILVNNAGITRVAPIQSVTLDTWAKIQDVNLRGTFLACQAVAPVMTSQRKGSIVNMASINAIRGNVNATAYAASKGGVTALTMALALELAPYGVRVNALCPATVDTDMYRSYMETFRDPAAEERVREKHPLGRIATPSDVASAALFLASSESAFITGVLLPIDGGRHIR